MDIRLHTLKVNQPIGTFYITKISGVSLYEMAKADIITITENRDDGIQRPLNEDKVRSIEDYLNAYDATFPTSIVLNVTNDYIIQQSHEEMVLRKNKNTFSIIDGQHRLQGFRYSTDFDFEVIVSIFVDLSKEQQARVFATINSEQTKVDPSISFYLEKNDNLYTPRKIVAQIASTFNIDNKSPWKGKIKLLGTKDNYFNDSVISLSAFAKPILGYIYRDDDFQQIRNELSLNKSDKISEILQEFKYNYPNKNYILWEFYASQNDKAIYKILFNYFNSFKKVFIKDWGNPKSILTKTTGYNAMMLLFKDLFLIGYKAKDFSEDLFYYYIKRMQHLDGTINSSRYGASGLKASRDLYSEFKKHIELKNN
ncbi:DGQHR domain-containing protein (plasmid) [Bacillus thuringiensis]|nr:DGQHR domain-containing protein [Bacillus thuringiensis]